MLSSNFQEIFFLIFFCKKGAFWENCVENTLFFFTKMTFITLTLSLGGNCGTLCFPEFSSTAEDSGRLLEVLPSSNCTASLEVALKKMAGKSFTPGSIRNFCRVSLPSQVKLVLKRGKLQCVQIFLCVKMCKLFLEMREKMRQPKMSFFLYFWTFLRGFTFFEFLGGKTFIILF